MRAFAVLTAIFILLEAGCCTARATASLNASSVNPDAALTWRHNPPPAQPPEAMHLPSPEIYTLDNGLIVELVADHRVPFTTAALGFKFGTIYEPSTLHGLAGLTASTLTEGTASKSSREIASEVDSIGGALKCSSSFDFTTLSGSSLSKYNDQLVGLLSEVLLHPSFPEDELILKQTNEIQELKVKRGDPEFLSEERFAKVIFGSHPYSVVAPTPESISKITRKDLQSFYRNHYLPDHAVLIIIGDFDAQQIKSTIKADFGQLNWKASSTTTPASTVPVAPVPAAPATRVYIVDRPSSVQSSIKIGNLALSKTDPDYFPLLVANQILGGGAQARLFLNLRESKGFTYGAYSHISPLKQCGSIEAGAGVRTDVTSPALQELLYELERIRNVKVNDTELTNAKTFLDGSFELGLETQSGLAQRLLEVQLYNLPPDYLQTYTTKIDKVTVADVRRVARKWIDLKHLSIVVVGDANSTVKDLECYAPVEVFDIYGKRELRTGTAVSNTEHIVGPLHDR